MSRFLDYLILAATYAMILLGFAGAAKGQTTQPAPLVITQGGYYDCHQATYTHYIVNTSAPVTINQAKFVGPSVQYSGHQVYGYCPVAANVTITNCSFAPAHAVYVGTFWNTSSAVYEHNFHEQCAGPIFMGSAKTVHIRYNYALDTNGSTSATSDNKVSAFQLDLIHCADIDIGFNQCINHPTLSVVEDNISLMESGGTSASPANIHDNFVDGQYSWPRTANSSGSGIMNFDPGSSNDATMGGFTRCQNNIVLAVENAGVDVAGSHSISLLNNIACNDGTSTLRTNVGIRTFNWVNKTPAEWFGPFVASGNQSYWLHGAPYSFAEPQTTSINNTSPVMSEAALRATWSAKLKAANITVGPVPPSYQTMPGTSWTAASSGVQNVPLPSEHLGPPTSCGYTSAGSYVQYPQVDFGNGVSTMTVSCATPLAGQSFAVHLDSATGPVIATVVAPIAKSWYGYVSVTVPCTSVTGVHFPVITFAGSVNLASLSFK